MKITINSIAGNLLFEGDFSCLAKAVETAIKSSADIRSANLRSANLRSADLRSADLSSADLSYADLSYADLRSADLSSADLRSADLSSADLRSANLSYANLSSADLSYANLSSADIRSANLRSANLRSADLRSADLSSANLSYANLSYANLSSADLSSAKNCEYAVAVTRILPEGEIVGWKKCKDGAIVRLVIPTDAKRSSAFGRKCRAEFVRVLEIFRDGKTSQDPAVSAFPDAEKIVYAVGETVRCDKWNEDFTVECGGGIHFFITRLEAENYDL